jgi:hypothetical protein
MDFWCGKKVKKLVEERKQIKKNRRWLRSSLAGKDEYPKLELSRAWEPSNSLRPLPDGEGEEA